MRSNLNGFPIDGSVGSQVKYDIFAKHLVSAIHSSASLYSSNTSMVMFIFAILTIPVILICSLLLFLNMIIKNIHYALTKKQIEKRKQELRLMYIRKAEEEKQAKIREAQLKEKELDELLSGLDVE